MKISYKNGTILIFLIIGLLYVAGWIILIILNKVK